MQELTAKQKAIHCQLFKDVTANTFFTVNVYQPYTTNDGLRAYPVVGKKNIFFLEDALMTAIYKGKYQKGLSHIVARKKQDAKIS